MRSAVRSSAGALSSPMQRSSGNAIGGKVAFQFLPHAALRHQLEELLQMATA
jgi:hypothetical protein